MKRQSSFQFSGECYYSPLLWAWSHMNNIVALVSVYFYTYMTVDKLMLEVNLHEQIMGYYVYHDFNISGNELIKKLASY